MDQRRARQTVEGHQKTLGVIHLGAKGHSLHRSGAVGMGGVDGPKWTCIKEVRVSWRQEQVKGNTPDLVSGLTERRSSSEGKRKEQIQGSFLLCSELSGEVARRQLQDQVQG